MVVFALLSAVNMVIQWSNIARGYKFVTSTAFVIHCIARIGITSVLVTLIVTMSAYYDVLASTQKSFLTFRKVAMIYFVLVECTPLLTLAAVYAIHSHTTTRRGRLFTHTDREILRHIPAGLASRIRRLRGSKRKSRSATLENLSTLYNHAVCGVSR
ncbi:hypothetical protein V1523DRAFT_20102 [Lipomyces doorenjongii]